LIAAETAGVGVAVVMMTSLHHAWSRDHLQGIRAPGAPIKHLPARNYRRRWSAIGTKRIVQLSTIIAFAMHYQCPPLHRRRSVAFALH